MANNIITNHTLEQYNKKYRNHRYRLLKVTKKEVEDFDKKNPTSIKGYLLKDRKWWLIKDTYYEIPKAPRYTWFRNLNGAVQLGCCLLGGGAVATAIVVPVVIANNNKMVSKNVDITGDGKDLIKQPYFIKQSDGSYKCKLEIADGKKKDDIKKIEIKAGNKVLVKDTDYTISDSFEIIIKAGVIKDDDNITIEVTKKDPGPSTYTISVTADTGGTVSGGGSYNAGVSVTVTASANNGYAFEGWYENDQKITGAESSYTFIATKDRSLKAKFTINTYTVTFDTDGGTSIPSQTIEYNQCATRPSTNPTKTDYTFDDWYTTKDGSTKFDFTTKITSNTTVYAHYTPNYTALLEFNVVGGTNVSVKKKSDATISGSLLIPSTIDGKYVTSGTPGTTYTVTQIIKSAFSNCSSLSSITIPDTITEIQEYAFSICTSLSSIVIPNNVEIIGNYAFTGCSLLSSIKIPSKVKLIGIGIFSSCTSLSSITVDGENTYFDSRNNCNAIINKSKKSVIAGCKNTVCPSDIISIEDHAFYGCTFNSFTIGEQVKTIGSYAFENCSSLSSIVLPNSVEVINESAFAGCYSLSSINISENVNTISSNAFIACSSLSSVYIGKNVQFIGTKAFANCSSLTSIIVDSENTYFDSRNNCNAIIDKTNNKLIVGCKNTTCPDDVVELVSYSFQGCSFNSFTIGEKVQTIGSYAFIACSSLSSIVIPNSVTSIQEYAFSGCPLSSIDLSNVTTVITGGNGMFPLGRGSKLTTGSIKIPSSLLDQYKVAQFWSNYAEYMIGV